MMAGLRKPFRLVAGLSLGALLVMSITELVNSNRLAWLDVDPRNAGHNFGFNLTFYIPATMLGSVLAAGAVFLFLHGLLALRATGARLNPWEYVTILPAVPKLLFDALLAISLFRLLTYSPS